MENKMYTLSSVVRVGVTGLVSMGISYGVQCLAPSTLWVENVIMSGMWGLLLATWLLQLEDFLSLRRVGQVLSSKPLEAPAELPKVVVEPVLAPVVTVAVEPVVVAVEKKVVAATKNVSIKKKAK